MFKLSKNVIDPKALSFEEVLEEIESFVASQKDGDRWSVFFESGAGRTLSELMAGLGAYFSYHSASQRREAYLPTARMRSSILELANTLGYPVNRRSAPKIKITGTLKTGKESELSLFNLSKIGETQDGRSVSLAGFTQESGSVFEVRGYLGEWRVLEQETPVDRAGGGEFFELDVVTREGFEVDNIIQDSKELVEDSRIILRTGTSGNLRKRELNKFVEELGENSVLVRTNSLGTVFVFGDGTLGRRLAQGESIRIDYLVTKGFFEGSLDSSVLSSEFLDLFDSTPQVEIMTRGSVQDSDESVVFKAPGYFSTRRRMVSLGDHENLFKGLSGKYVDAKSSKAGQVKSFEFSSDDIGLGTEKNIDLDVEPNGLTEGSLVIEILFVSQVRQAFNVNADDTSDFENWLDSNGFSAFKTWFLNEVSNGRVFNKDEEFLESGISRSDFLVLRKKVAFTESGQIDLSMKEFVRDLGDGVLSGEFFSGDVLYSTGEIRLERISGGPVIDKLIVKGSLGYENVSGECSCCTVRFSYVAVNSADESYAITDKEKRSEIDRLNEFKMVGTALLIIDPVKFFLKIGLNILLERGTNQSDVTDGIERIVRTNERKLAQPIFLGEIVKKVSELNGVSRVYLKFPQEDVELGFNEFFEFDLKNSSILYTFEEEELERFGESGTPTSGIDGPYEYDFGTRDWKKV